MVANFNGEHTLLLDKKQVNALKNLTLSLIFQIQHYPICKKIFIMKKFLNLIQWTPACVAYYAFRCNLVYHFERFKDFKAWSQKWPNLIICVHVNTKKFEILF